LSKQKLSIAVNELDKIVKEKVAREKQIMMKNVYRSVFKSKKKKNNMMNQTAIYYY